MGCGPSKNSTTVVAAAVTHQETTGKSDKDTQTEDNTASQLDNRATPEVQVDTRTDSKECDTNATCGQCAIDKHVQTSDSISAAALLSDVSHAKGEAKSPDTRDVKKEEIDADGEIQKSAEAEVKAHAISSIQEQLTECTGTEVTDDEPLKNNNEENADHVSHTSEDVDRIISQMLQEFREEEDNAAMQLQNRKDNDNVRSMSGTEDRDGTEHVNGTEGSVSATLSELHDLLSEETKKISETEDRKGTENVDEPFKEGAPEENVSTTLSDLKGLLSEETKKMTSLQSDQALESFQDTNVPEGTETKCRKSSLLVPSGFMFSTYTSDGRTSPRLSASFEGDKSARIEKLFNEELDVHPSLRSVSSVTPQVREALSAQFDKVEEEQDGEEGDEDEEVVDVIKTYGVPTDDAYEEDQSDKNNIFCHNVVADDEGTLNSTSQEATAPDSVPSNDEKCAQAENTDTLPSTASSEDMPPAVVTKKDTLPAVTSRENTLPAVVPKEDTLPAVASKEDTMPAVVPKEDTLPSTVPKEDTLPAVASKGEMPSAVVPKEDTLPAVVPKEDTLPAVASNEDTLQSAAFKENTLSAVATKEDTLPAVASKEDTLPSATFKENTLPAVATKEDTLLAVAPKEDTLPSAAFKEDTLPSAATKEDTLPAVVPKEDTLPSAAFKEDTLPSAATKEDTLPSVAFKEDTLPVVTTKKDTLPALASKEETGETLRQDTITSVATKDTLPIAEPKEDMLPSVISKEQVGVTSNQASEGDREPSVASKEQSDCASVQEHSSQNMDSSELENCRCQSKSSTPEHNTESSEKTVESHVALLEPCVDLEEKMQSLHQMLTNEIPSTASPTDVHNVSPADIDSPAAVSGLSENCVVEVSDKQHTSAGRNDAMEATVGVESFSEGHGIVENANMSLPTVQQVVPESRRDESQNDVMKDQNTPDKKSLSIAVISASTGQESYDDATVDATMADENVTNQ